MDYEAVLVSLCPTLKRPRFDRPGDQSGIVRGLGEHPILLPDLFTTAIAFPGRDARQRPAIRPGRRPPGGSDRPQNGGTLQAPENTPASTTWAHW